jgi:hypothetical protein
MPGVWFEKEMHPWLRHPLFLLNYLAIVFIWETFMKKISQATTLEG